MTCTVLSILVMFVCLAHTLDVKTWDDYKNAIDDFELYINSLKKEDFEMAANSFIDEQIRTMDIVFNIMQYIGPEHAAAKKLFEAVKELIPQLKAKRLLSAKDLKLFWEYVRKGIEGLKDLDKAMLIKNEL